MEKTIPQMQAENIKQAIADGPALRTSYNHWIVAKDSKAGRVLLGGLGCMGVGEMWFQDEPRYADYPGYAEAPERESYDPTQAIFFANVAAESNMLENHNNSKVVDS